MQRIDKFFKEENIAKLKRYYGEALSNESFKEYIDNIDLSDDDLIKYTSSIEDCVKEKENCKKCPGIKNCPNVLKGHIYTGLKAGKGVNFTYIPCDKYVKEEKKYAYKKNITCFDLPKEISEASFKDAYRDDNKRLPIFKYFKEFIDNYNKKKDVKGLYLSGSFGSGKTYLVAALFNELAKKDIHSALVYYPELNVLCANSPCSTAAIHYQQELISFKYLKNLFIVL